MRNTIKVVVKFPGEPPEDMIIENEFQAFQRIVRGYIETVTICSDLVLICNEDGRLREMEPNVRVGGVTFVGPVIFAGVKGDEFADVPDLVMEQFDRIAESVGKAK